MTQQLWTSVDDYITDLFVPFDPVMQETLAASEAAGLPSISVAPNEGKLLMLLAQLCGARNILEIGTLGGYSTIWLARGMASVGSLITLGSQCKTRRDRSRQHCSRRPYRLGRSAGGSGWRYIAATNLRRSWSIRFDLH